MILKDSSSEVGIPTGQLAGVLIASHAALRGKVRHASESLTAALQLYPPIPDSIPGFCPSMPSSHPPPGAPPPDAPPMVAEPEDELPDSDAAWIDPYL